MGSRSSGSCLMLRRSTSGGKGPWGARGWLMGPAADAGDRLAMTGLLAWGDCCLPRGLPPAMGEGEVGDW